MGHGQQGMKIDGRYVLERKLGGGGFGEVWRATSRVGSPVAVKLAHETNPDSEEIRRFRREAHVSAHLGKRPCFVPAFDVGRCDTTGLHFIVYELVEDATPLLVREGGLVQRLGRVAHAARAVAQAHSLGVIHRDVKPDNFLVGKDGVARLHDFGLAKLMSETPIERDPETQHLNTERFSGFGTPGYVSLEQLEDAATADASTDVFALGAILYEALMGEVWHPHRRLAELLRTFDAIRARSRPPPSVEGSPLLRGHTAETQHVLTQLCGLAMQVDRAARKISAEQFANELDRLVRSIPPHVADDLWSRVRDSPTKLVWLLEQTWAEPAKRAIRRVVPPSLLADIPKTDGLVHYVERLQTHLARGGRVEGLEQEPSVRQAWLEQGLHTKLVALEGSGFFNAADSPPPTVSRAGPRDCVAAALFHLGRASLLAAAERLADGEIRPRWPLARIAAKLARYDHDLVDGLTLEDLREIARARSLSPSGLKAEVFGRVACSLAWQSDAFDSIVAETLAQLLTKEKLLELARRLGDEDVRAYWSNRRIADELVKHEHGGVLQEMTATDLKALLAEFGLSTAGDKTQLVARAALAGVQSRVR